MTEGKQAVDRVEKSGLLPMMRLVAPESDTHGPTDEE